MYAIYELDNKTKVAKPYRPPYKPEGWTFAALQAAQDAAAQFNGQWQDLTRYTAIVVKLETALLPVAEREARLSERIDALEDGVRSLATRINGALNTYHQRISAIEAERASQMSDGK